MESFFATLKEESVHEESYATREAKAILFESIEVFYNQVRRHSALGDPSPAEYEKAP